jgi:hypothetical protein
MRDQDRLTGEQSLQIIEQMIHTAKKEQKDNGVGWIIWGWMLLVASVLTYFNLRYQWFDAFIFWNIFGLLTVPFALYSVLKTIFLKSKKPVKTYTADLFEKLNIGFFIFLFLIIFGVNNGVGPVKGFILLVGLYGFWELIYGAVLNFKPSIIGAYVSWAIAFAGLYVNDMGNVMLLHGLAVLCGYVIPGHIAYREFKKINRTN